MHAVDAKKKLDPAPTGQERNRSEMCRQVIRAAALTIFPGNDSSP